MEKPKRNRGVLVSIAVCGALVFVGIVRVLSYHQGLPGDIIRSSPLRVLCYDPGSLLSAQFFKLLATPTVVALIYFFFRWRNSGAPAHLHSPSLDSIHILDFKAPLLRIILTTVITVNWLGMEWWKFNSEGFYPWSELENRSLNVVVLIVSQALSFWAMKYLSFQPIVKDPAQPER